MIEKLAYEMNYKNPLRVGTGGYVRIFKDDGLFDIIDFSLSLKGLKIIYDLNKNS